MHRRREIQSLEMHRRIAALMESEPERVIGKARENLFAWRLRREDDAAGDEWLALLDRLSPGELAAFLVSETEDALRMRQSSPFAGVLSPREVWAIKHGHEAA